MLFLSVEIVVRRTAARGGRMVAIAIANAIVIDIPIIYLSLIFFVFEIKFFNSRKIRLINLILCLF